MTKIMAMLTGTDSRQIIPAVHRDFQGIKDMAALVDYLNEILREMPDIPQRDTLFEFFTNIVNEMAQRKELPPSSNIPSAPVSYTHLTLPTNSLV